MKRVTKTAFRDTPSVELGRNGVLEVVSHGSVVGYWVPRDEWAFGSLVLRLLKHLVDDVRDVQVNAYASDDGRYIPDAEWDALCKAVRDADHAISTVAHAYDVWEAGDDETPT